MSSYTKQFDDTVDKFFKDIERILPSEINKIQEYKSMLSMARFIGGHIDLFFSNSIPYKKQIFEKDVNFFLEAASSSMTSSLGISDHWNSFSDSDKNLLWTHFQMLYLLAYLSKGYKDEDFQIHLEN